MVNNVLIEVMGAIAEQERIKICTRQKEGIQAMKQRGDWDKYGRHKIAVPEFVRFYKKTVDGEITAVKAYSQLGITKAKWYRLCKEQLYGK